jgi:hypothetical protein
MQSSKKESRKVKHYSSTVERNQALQIATTYTSGPQMDGMGWGGSGLHGYTRVVIWFAMSDLSCDGWLST